MAGITYRITVDDHGAAKSLRNLISKAEDRLPLMKSIARIAVASVQENFRIGGRPKWAANALSTLRRKGGKPVLFFHGFLRNVVFSANATTARVGVQPNTEAYAAIQNFGGTIKHPGGTPYWSSVERPGLAEFVSKAVGAKYNLPVTKPHDIKIPARPYMLLQPEDLDDIKTTAEEYLKDALAGKA